MSRQIILNRLNTVNRLHIIESRTKQEKRKVLIIMALLSILLIFLIVADKVFVSMPIFGVLDFCYAMLYFCFLLPLCGVALRSVRKVGLLILNPAGIEISLKNAVTIFPINQLTKLHFTLNDDGTRTGGRNLMSNPIGRGNFIEIVFQNQTMQYEILVRNEHERRLIALSFKDWQETNPQVVFKNNMKSSFYR